uniref:Maturase K n=1 Tax=Panagrolaimus superbus TaxID=310955 RepID=A0A914YZF5_9BILA
MACVNQDLLFDIGKLLFEDGNRKDFFKFALSGKEPFQAMKKYFSTFTILELYDNYYVIGREEEKCLTYKFRNDEPHSKFLLYHVGNCVQKLHIKAYFIKRQLYQLLFDKIVAKKQLISFSAAPSCDTTFLNEFLPKFSSTLKNVIIPNIKMTRILRDTLNLDTLTISCQSFFSFVSFCCKTSTLVINNGLLPLSKWIPDSDKISPFLSSIKEITFNETEFHITVASLFKITKYFSSLESLNFIISIEESVSRVATTERKIKWSIAELVEVMNVKNILIPEKVTFFFYKSIKATIPDLCHWKKYFIGFDYDETNSDFYCFRKLYQTADSSQTKTFEIQIAN